jgi:hypothetical protein
MTSSRSVRIAGRTAIALALAAGLYLGVYRPLQLRWGATPAELARAMPGDDIQPHPAFNATRAVSIHAPPEAIWPWLVQIGYQRAGWYSALDWADNGGLPSAERIVPALQGLKVGDAIPVTGRGDPLSFVPEINWRVVDLQPDRHLLATSETGQDSWLWLLQPSPDGPTRLIWRMRNGPYAWTSPFITLQLATDLGDFIFVRNILLSIKERVEGRPIGSLAASTAMVMVWLFAFVEFLGALVVFIARRDGLRPLAAIAATAATTLVLVFTMPPLWVDLLAVVALTGGLVWLRSHLVAP